MGRHIKAHEGHPWNELADTAANMARTGVISSKGLDQIAAAFRRADWAWAPIFDSVGLPPVVFDPRVLHGLSVSVIVLAPCQHQLFLFLELTPLRMSRSMRNLPGSRLNSRLLVPMFKVLLASTNILRRSSLRMTLT